MGTDVTDNTPANSPIPPVGEVVGYPSLRGQAQANDISILGGPQKGRLREFAFGSTPETVRERGDGTIAVAHDTGGA